MKYQVLFCLLSAAGCSVYAQSVHIEAFVSGGCNVSYGTAVEHVSQQPYLTLYAQGNIGYTFSSGFGIEAGMTYFPIGITRVFAIRTGADAGLGWSKDYNSTVYDYMPHVFGWYSLQKTRWLPASQIGIGLLYARFSSSIVSSFTSEVELTSGQVLYSRSSSEHNGTPFLGVEARWDVRLWHRPAHEMYAVLHLVKGINAIRHTTLEYSIGNMRYDQRSEWTTYGDYLGLGLSYKLKRKVRQAARP